MKQTINMPNGDSIIITKDLSYCCHMLTITKGYFKDGDLNKTIRFSMCDDFSFEGFNIDDDKLEKMDFTFEVNDPLYKYLDAFLDDEDKIIIDDDATREENKKTMTFYREKDYIVISFENKLTSTNAVEKFLIFIKNIVTDYRSKIDQHGYDTKVRLINFFNSINNELLEQKSEEIQKVYTKKDTE